MPKQEQSDDKFYYNKPLVKFRSDDYIDICLLKHNKKITWLHYEEDFLYEAIRGVNLCRQENDYIVFAIKASPEKFSKYDYLSSIDGPGFIVHQRVVNKFNEMCPKDFQAFPIIIKNLNLKDEYFENRDYYLINVLNLVDAIDLERTTIDDSSGIAWVKGYTYFKEDCMDGYLLARNSISKSQVLFHPTLAREFVKCKGVKFMSDKELPYS